RFIVRQFSPVVTIGGGVVLDNLARRPAAKDTSRVDFLLTLEKFEPRETLRAMTFRSLFGLNQQEIVAKTGWTDERVKEAARQEEQAGHLKLVSSMPLLLVGQNVFAEMRAKIMATLDAFHKNNPLSPGIAREELRIKSGRRVRQEIFRSALEQ